jgi:hypothetical protein
MNSPFPYNLDQVLLLEAEAARCLCEVIASVRGERRLPPDFGERARRVINALPDDGAYDTTADVLASCQALASTIGRMTHLMAWRMTGGKVPREPAN